MGQPRASSRHPGWSPTGTCGQHNGRREQAYRASRAAAHALPNWLYRHTEAVKLTRMVRVVPAEQLRVGDVVHLHTDTSVVRIELTTIARRTKGYKCTGYRADDRDRVSPWSFGVLFEQPVEIEEPRS